MKSELKFELIAKSKLKKNNLQSNSCDLEQVPLKPTTAWPQLANIVPFLAMRKQYPKGRRLRKADEMKSFLLQSTSNGNETVFEKKSRKLKVPKFNRRGI